MDDFVTMFLICLMVPVGWFALMFIALCIDCIILKIKGKKPPTDDDVFGMDSLD